MIVSGMKRIKIKNEKKTTDNDVVMMSHSELNVVFETT